MDMTKRAVKTVLGFTTDVELAQLFNCTKQAVGQWPEDEPLPEKRQLQLVLLYPDRFRAAPQLAVMPRDCRAA